MHYLPLPSCPSLLFSPLQGQSAPPRWKFCYKICQEPRQKVLGTPPPVELHCKKGSLRLTELRPWRHLCSGITILGKRKQRLAWKQQNNLGQIHHMYSDSHIYLLSEKGLVFYLYLQKFHLDFSISTVIFAAANFDKRKFFLRHPVYSSYILWILKWRW